MPALVYTPTQGIVAPQRIMPLKKLILTALLTSALVFLSSSAHALYKWTDAEGNTHYSDKLPPEHIRHERAILNQRGIEVDRIKAAPTEEDLERQRKEKELRAMQKQLLKKQQAEDKRLLDAYRTEEDLLLARDGKLAAIDTTIAVLQGNILRAKRLLLERQNELDQLQKAGQPPPQKKIDEMARYRSRVEANYQNILRYEEKKQAIRNKFDVSLDRYRNLKKGGTGVALPEAKEEKSPEDDDYLELETVALCKTPEECNRLWLNATRYVTDKSDTPIRYTADKTLLTAIPGKDDQISLTVSQLPRGDDASHWIFLDVQCRATPLGLETCESERAWKIRKGFRDAVTQGEIQPRQSPSTPPQAE